YFFVVGHGRAGYVSRGDGDERNIRLCNSALARESDFCAGEVLGGQRTKQFFCLRYSHGPSPPASGGASSSDGVSGCSSAWSGRTRSPTGGYRSIEPEASCGAKTNW